jgi:hypothetical protein
MADGTLAGQDPVATLANADLFYVDDGPGVDAKCTGTVLKAFTSASPTLVTPDLGVPSAGDISACTGTLTSITLVTPALGTPASGDISACTSTNMALTTPDLGVPSAIDITAATGTVTSLTLVTPALGVVASGNIAACTGTTVELAAHIAGNTVAVTATADGTGTGLIPATAEYVTVVCDDATKQISLPAAIAGKIIRIAVNGAENVELISAVAGDKVNFVVVGATNEALLVQTSLYTLVYDAASVNWVMQGLTNLGAVETPVVPDSLA